MFKLLFAVILSIFLSSTAFAMDFFNTKADTAYNKGDYKTAYEIWQPLAEKGDANAQMKMGVRYYDGNGVRKNYVEALKWYKLSAEQGNTKAQINLGSMYHTGIGVPQNPMEAYKWLSLAASIGDVTGISLKETLAREMTPQQISEGNKLVREWMEKHSK
jgi:TPR repeat protein